MPNIYGVSKFTLDLSDDAMMDSFYLFVVAYQKINGQDDLVENLFRIAAEQGHTGSMFALGSFLKDSEDPGYIYWYRMAAESGSAAALTILGNVEGFHGNLIQAKRIYEVAATHKDVAAYYNLGVLFELYEDFTTAKYWFALASEAGDLDGKFKLGCMYERELNFTLAGAVLKSAASRGHYLAMVRLGWLYLKLGLENESSEWFQKAFDQRYE